MKLLAFTDIHGSISAINKIKQKVKAADYLVCCGDITIFETNIEEILTQIDKIGKPVLMIPGNHESEELMDGMCKIFDNLISIHKHPHKIGDTLFLGYGGGGFSFKDPDFAKTMKRYAKQMKAAKKVVIVTHAPPYGTKVDMVLDQHTGNITMRKFIEKSQPTLFICGHIHECNGKRDKLGETKIVNPGPFGKLLTV